jgi:hypothetical protein
VHTIFVQRHVVDAQVELSTIVERPTSNVRPTPTAAPRSVKVPLDINIVPQGVCAKLVKHSGT